MTFYAGLYCASNEDSQCPNVLTLNSSALESFTVLGTLLMCADLCVSCACLACVADDVVMLRASPEPERPGPQRVVDGTTRLLLIAAQATFLMSLAGRAWYGRPNHVCRVMFALDIG